MELSALLGFASIAAALIVIPGPDWAFILAAGALDHVVLPAVAGLMTGYAVITIVVAIGVGPVVSRSPATLLALTTCGAAYLICLGLKTWAGPADIGHTAQASATGPSRAGYVLRGAGVTALNPKGLLVFLAILPQFARPSAAWPMTAQLAVLGSTFVVICGLFYLALGSLSDRVLAARPLASGVLTKLAGIAMVGVGAALLIERLLDAI